MGIGYATAGKEAVVKANKLYIPADLDFTLIPGYEEKHHDKYAYLISTIYLEGLLSDSFDGFVNLRTDLLMKIIGKTHYYKIRDGLETCNIIDIDHTYSQGDFSKSYRLNIISKFKFVSISDKKIDGRITKWKQDLQKNLKKEKVHNGLKYNLQELEIDHESAYAFISDRLKKDPSYCLNQYAADESSIGMIQNKDFRFVVDTKAGRVHTNVTNISRELRQFFIYIDIKGDRQRLVNIDIANSQPCLFNSLINDYLKDSRYYNTTSNTKPTNNTKTTTNNILSYVSENFISNNNSELCREIKLYRDLTMQGKFYEYCMKEFKIDLSQRDDFKKVFFKTIFFSKVNDNYRHHYSRMFEDLFPNIYKIILHYKKGDYKNLPISLQRSEADIMIKNVSKRIVHDYKGVFFLTIHDSIVCTEEYADKFYDIMMEELQKRLGDKPTLNKKPLEAETIDMDNPKGTLDINPYGLTIFYNKLNDKVTIKAHLDSEDVIGCTFDNLKDLEKKLRKAVNDIDCFDLMTYCDRQYRNLKRQAA